MRIVENKEDYDSALSHCSKTVSEPSRRPMVFRLQSVFWLHPLYSLEKCFVQLYTTSCNYSSVLCPLTYLLPLHKDFPHLNHLSISSSGKLRLRLRISKVTASVTLSALSQRRLTHLPPFPQCFADTSSTTLPITGSETYCLL